jgi:hypothetical protein
LEEEEEEEEEEKFYPHLMHVIAVGVDFRRGWCVVG